MDGKIKISDAHARVIERAINIQNSPYQINLNTLDDDQLDSPYFPKSKSTLHIKSKPKYHAQLFQYQLPENDYIYADSELNVKNNNESMLKFNLLSPIFDHNFDIKEISNVYLVKNHNGSVDVVIKFNENDDISSRNYPHNPVYSNKQIGIN